VNDQIVRPNDILSTAELATGESRASATPMMEQFIEIKAANPDSLLFYRMGDFYELFFQDAVDASRALGITLTRRGQHMGLDIPMCGVPIHAADDYLQKLISLGFRVAVCEQVEDPAEAKKRGSKSVVRRDVVRLVTPGTLTEEKLLSPSEAARSPRWRSPGSISRPASSACRKPLKANFSPIYCASTRAN
jgi:DNA mismatch repair protein MutS